MKKIFYLIILILLISIPNVSANTKNLVNIYLFHSNTCPHCREEIKVLNELEEKYDNIKIYKYEIGDPQSSLLMSQVKEIYNTKITSVPFTIIGNKTFSGYSSEDGKRTFIAAIEYFSIYGYTDEIAKLKSYEEPTYEVNTNNPDIDSYIDNYGNYDFTFPLIGKINTKDLSLPTISILMGSIEGFNPIAIWGLLLLISILITFKDKKIMWILGSIFLIIQAISCFLMITFANVAIIIKDISIINILVGILSIIVGIYLLLNITNKDKKEITLSKSIFIIILASIIVSLLILTYSIGLPIMFNQLLEINDVNLLEKVLYSIIYIIFYLIDDLIIFIIIITTINLKDKYKKYAKVVSSLIILVIGLLLVIKPEWLMFKF